MSEVLTLRNDLETAWGIIANAYGGNWELASEDWRDAACKFRERFHAALDRAGGHEAYRTAVLNPEGIPTLIASVEQVVAVLNVAKMQYGWEDSTNVLSTLEGALRGCALTPEPPAT